MDRRARLTIVLVLALPLIALGSWPLIDPDESRTAEVAREILASGNWVTPHINGIPRLDKPILPYASVAAAMRIGGETPFAARLPGVFALALTALLTGLAFRRELGESGARLAILFTASAPMLLIWQRSAAIDPLLSLFVTATTAGWWRGWRDGRALPAVLGWTAAGLGLLTKGPIALLLPLAASAPLWRREGWSRTLHPGGIAIGIAIPLAWVALVVQEHPGFIDYVIGTEIVARTTSRELDRSGAVWLPLVSLVIGALPFSVSAIREISHTLRRRREVDDLDRLLLAWIFIPLLIFTLAASRRPQYVLPLIPAVSLLAARRLSRPESNARTESFVCFALALLLVGGGIAASTRGDLPVHILLIAAGGAALAWTVAGIALRAPGGRPRFMMAAASIALFPLALIPLLRVQGERQSGFEVAQRIIERQIDTSQLVGLHTYSPSVSFALGTTYRVVTHHGRELGGNYIASRYGELIDRPGSPLRSRGWFEQTIERCSEPLHLLTRNDDRSTNEYLRGREITPAVMTDRFYLWSVCSSGLAEALSGE